ncbi:MAG: chemotaxis protein CheD [Opitutae bacterium]|nr:chemotaxis protein CheD [Opitutae bacterium]
MRSSGFIAPPAPPADLVFGEAVLWAGDIVVETKPVRMNTVLGSCVSVCLYDAQRQFGGMNHYLVPRGGQTANHGEWAVANLIERMCALGSSPRAMQAKIFGGGSPLKLANETYAVGSNNVAVAHTVLEQHGIPIVAERVGHNGGLRLFFENWTGTVWLRLHSS